jgi:hypothetical protein
MATQVSIFTDEVFPVYFIDTNPIYGETLDMDEFVLAEFLTVQDNFWLLQKKLRDMYMSVTDGN